MRYFLLPVIAFALAALPSAVQGQPKARNAKKDAAFVLEKPTVGDPLPELTVFTPDGQPFQTTDLRGGYAVVTFGCLT